MRNARRAIPLLLAVVAAALLPASASGDRQTFLSTTDLYGTGGALTEGPADPYPSDINVTGLSGTVTKVAATVLGTNSGHPQDLEIGLTGPNGRTVMLASDACGGSQTGADWLIDDDAQTFLPAGGDCGGVNDGVFKPSNYGDPALDDFSLFSDGPPPPYLNALSFLAGGTPNGAWRLWFVDDGPGFFAGIGGWALHLEVNPPVTVKKPRKCKKRKRGAKRTARKKRCKKAKKKR